MVRMSRTGTASEQFVGEVEEVDSGRALRFGSPEELIQFLREPSYQDRSPGSHSEPESLEPAEK